MKNSDIEISVVYKNNVVEDFIIDEKELDRTIKQAKDESRSDFHIGEKQFIKEDVAVVATSDYSIQFL